MMKKRLFLAGIISLAIVFALFFAGCPTDGGGGEDGGGDTVVTMAAISGVTAPVTGGTPVTAIAATAQYTGSVTWQPAVTTTFAAGTSYTATISLTARDGYTFAGVTANFFTVAGASAVTNAAHSGVVTAVFPAASSAGTTVTIAAIGGITAPATGGTPVAVITETTQYTGSVTWQPPVAATFAANTTYMATITLVAKAGYTFSGVAANFFTVAGATTVTNAAHSGVATAVFPTTNPGLTITAKSTELEAVWPRFGDLVVPADYHVRYKANATGVSDIVGSTPVAAANITQPITGSFKAEITLLINDVTYTVWVFKTTDAYAYTTATPLYTGTGKPVGAATVTLAPKSHGTAGANSISGLNPSAKYVVKEGNLWYPVAANGDLGNGGALDAATVSSTASGLATIGNLNNNRTYNVFLVKPFPDDNVTLGTADTNSKNTIANVKDLSSGKKLNISTSGGGGTLIVLTNEENVVAIVEKPIAVNDSIGSAAKTYLVSEPPVNATNIKIKATQNDKYAEIDLSGAVEGSLITFTVQ
jgi:hypothetical protein